MQKRWRGAALDTAFDAYCKGFAGANTKGRKKRVVVKALRIPHQSFETGDNSPFRKAEREETDAQQKETDTP